MTRNDFIEQVCNMLVLNKSMIELCNVTSMERYPYERVIAICEKTLFYLEKGFSFEKAREFWYRSIDAL